MASSIYSDQIARASQQLDRLQTFFPRVEGKASFLLAVNLGLLTILAANVDKVAYLAAPLVWVPGAAFMLFWGVSIWKLNETFFPHLKGGSVHSVFYFRDIASRSFKEYSHRMKSINDEDILDDLLCQVWRNSEILKVKFDSVQSAFRFAVLSLVFWLVTLGALSVVAERLPKVS